MTEGSRVEAHIALYPATDGREFFQQLYNAVDGIVVGNFAAAGRTPCCRRHLRAHIGLFTP